MSTAKALEYRIIQQLLHARTGRSPDRHGSGIPWAERVIAILGLTVGLLTLGSYLQELLWVLLVVGAVFVMGIVDK
jgi:hypothetical protein